MNMNEKHSYFLMRPAARLTYGDQSQSTLWLTRDNFVRCILHVYHKTDGWRVKAIRSQFFGEFCHARHQVFSTSLSGIQELNLSGYPFHLTKAFFFFWSRRITFSIRKIF